MGILIGKDTRVVVQGISGRMGKLHTERMLDYGTHIFAGVAPGKDGQWEFDTIPVFNTVKESVEAQGANTSIIFVPPRFAPDAILEAVDAGIELIVCVTESIPIQDMIRVQTFLKNSDTRLVGPNSPGIISPADNVSVGTMPGSIFRPGPVGIVSRSRTLTYSIVQSLNKEGIGQSTVISLGGDPIKGTTFTEAITLFYSDPFTKHVVLIGEIGGFEEQQAADFIAQYPSKPVTVFMAGYNAPVGKLLGPAGAIIEDRKDTVADKIDAFKAVGVTIARFPNDVARLVKASLNAIDSAMVPSNIKATPNQIEV